MKKILRSFIFVLAGLLTVVALASCGHSHKYEYESDNTKHRQVCEECGDEQEWEAHTWGDWVVTKEATEDEKGSRMHACTACGKEVSEDISEKEPATGVATELTAVYAQVPADWEVANVYYWNNLTGEENTLPDDYKVVWPGVEMTLVDETTHLYGFKVPAGVNMLIFNNGDAQTVDIKLALAKNLYVLDTEAEDQKSISISYRAYTPKDTDPVLGEPVVTVIERITLYAQLPAEWAAQKIHYWGLEETKWPGADMVEVDAENHIYKLDNFITSSGFILNSGDGSQTENLALIEGKDINIIIVAEDNTVSYGKYENGVITPVEVETAFPDVYVRGDMNSWAAKDEYKLVVDGNKATLEISILAGKSFKIADANYGKQFGYVDTLGEEFENGGGLGAANITCVVSGKYRIVLDNLDGEPTLTITRIGDSEIEEEDHTITELYVVGSINSWTKSDDHKFTIADDTATIELTLAADDEFKIFDGSWDHNWSTFGYVDSLGEAFANNNGNIKVVTANTYVITISGLNTNPVLSIQAKA
ncbi:MAG: starch-binding protein [Anaeroplasmataceae bacterium]|nr:starch-binding protein [Anaeroplasmataceae bacterium]